MEINSHLIDDNDNNFKIVIICDTSDNIVIIYGESFLYTNNIFVYEIDNSYNIIDR